LAFDGRRNVNAKVMELGLPYGLAMSVNFFNVYINDDPKLVFADGTCLYATNRKEGFIVRTVRTLQRGFSSMDAWCERWNIKLN
jgi:hypothetical protein